MIQSVGLHDYSPIVYNNMPFKANTNNTVKYNIYQPEKKKNTGWKILGAVSAAALIVAGVCFYKGGKALGENAKFGEKLKQGWHEIWGNSTKNVANNALNEAAHAAGVEDVTLYKNMKEIFGNVSKHDETTFEWEDFVKKIRQLIENGKIQEGDKFSIVPPKMTQECFSKKYSGKLPENAFAFSVESLDGKTTKYTELVLNNKLGESFKDFVPADKIYQGSLKIE